MKNVLITGSGGFLGQHINATLQKGLHFVTGVDKRPERWQTNCFVQTKVEDLGYRDLAGIDTVVHLAWRTNIPDCIRHPIESTNDNINMTVKLFERCKEAGVKHFVFPSTASLYSLNKTPWREDMPTIPIEPYSWQKEACESYIKMNKGDMKVSIMRFFQVFGEFQRSDTALSAFLRLKKDGKPVTLTETTAQSSFKSAQRDFIYAGDLARAVALIVEKEEEGVFNVCTGEITTMEQIAEAMESEVSWIPRRPHEVECHLGDPSRLKALGWKPEVNVIDWLKKQI